MWATVDMNSFVNSRLNFRKRKENLLKYKLQNHKGEKVLKNLISFSVLKRIGNRANIRYILLIT